MGLRKGSPRAQSEVAPPLALFSVLLHVVLTSILAVQLLALLRRRDRERRVEAGLGKESLGSASAARERRLPPSEEAAFKAGVNTTFDVIAVLRDLVDQALKSAQDEDSVSSRNGRGKESNPPEVGRP